MVLSTKRSKGDYIMTGYKVRRKFEENYPIVLGFITAVVDFLRLGESYHFSYE